MQEMQNFYFSQEIYLLQIIPSLLELKPGKEKTDKVIVDYNISKEYDSVLAIMIRILKIENTKNYDIF